MVFSALFRFFTGPVNKQEQQPLSTRPTDIDEIINTVCHGFDTHRTQIENIHSSINDIENHLSSKPSQTELDLLKSEVLKNSTDIENISSYLSDTPSTQSLQSIQDTIISRDEISSMIKEELNSFKSHIFDEIRQNTYTHQDKSAQKTGSIPNLIPQRPVYDRSPSRQSLDRLTTLEKKILRAMAELKAKQGVDELSLTELSGIIYPGSDPKTKRPTLSAYISKLEASGFITKTRSGPTVYISLVGEKVIDFFMNENYTRLKKVL